MEEAEAKQKLLVAVRFLASTKLLIGDEVIETFQVSFETLERKSTMHHPTMHSREA